MTRQITVPTEVADDLLKISKKNPKAIKFIASLADNPKAESALSNPLSQVAIKAYLR